MATTYYVDMANGNDSNAGTSEGAGNAWQTLGKAASTVVAGDTVNVKATADYTEILTLSVSGTVTAPIRWEGYTSTVGDGGFATIDGANTRATCVQFAAIQFNFFSSFIFKGATTQVLGWTGLAHLFFHHCKILKGTGTAPVSMQPTANFDAPQSDFYRCEVANFGGAGILNVSPEMIFESDIHDNGSHGISLPSFRICGSIVGNLIYDNAGDGIHRTDNGAASGAGVLICNNTIDNNTGDGIEIDGASNGRFIITNNVITSNGGWGINVSAALAGTAAIGTVILVGKNFYRSNTSGVINNTARVNVLEARVDLSGDPYTNAGSDDYSLDNTAGEGAAVRAARTVGAFTGGTTTSFADGGAVQHQDAGGGGGNTILAGSGIGLVVR